jgi:hypothetical protein
MSRCCFFEAQKRFVQLSTNLFFSREKESYTMRENHQIGGDDFFFSLLSVFLLFFSPKSSNSFLGFWGRVFSRHLSFANASREPRETARTG